MRSFEVKRKTNETDIDLKLNIDGVGNCDVKTGAGFLDHMLTLFAKHAHFDLYVRCIGDTDVDYHHTAEDVAICLGQAFFNCLGDKKGICRYADRVIPMDEALILIAVDISGRPFLVYNSDTTAPMIGDYDAQLTLEFMRALAYNMGATLHVRSEYGVNQHHITEAIFKAVARAIGEAVTPFGDGVLSAKGVL